MSESVSSQVLNPEYEFMLTISVSMLYMLERLYIPRLAS
jgi:hypothetical protein